MVPLVGVGHLLWSYLGDKRSREMIEEVVIIGLAAWRATALMSYERGPFDIFLRFRRLLGFEHDEKGEPNSWPSNTLARTFSCSWCLGGYATAGMWGLWQISDEAVIVLAAWSILIAVEKWNHHGAE